jgi:hypothetical protein
VAPRAIDAAFNHPEVAQSLHVDTTVCCDTTYTLMNLPTIGAVALRNYGCC